MKFVALITIVPNRNEEEAIEIAKKAGAGSVTIMQGNHIGLQEKKVFFGLTLEENVSVLLFILPIRLSMEVLKAIKEKFNIDDLTHENGMVFTMPLSHVSGFDKEELSKFENNIKNTL